MYQNGYQGNQGGNFWQQAPFQSPLENREIIELLKLLQSGEIAAAKLALDQKVADDRWVLGVLTHLQRAEQEKARLELQKAAQDNRMAMDILKFVQAGQLAQADQLHRQAAELQRWRIEMLRLIAQGKIEAAKNALQEQIHKERMSLAWVQHNQRVQEGLQRFALDQGKFVHQQKVDADRFALDQSKLAHQKGVDAARFGFDQSKFTYQQQIDVQRLNMLGQQIQQGWLRVEQSERQLNKGRRRAFIALCIIGAMILVPMICLFGLWLALRFTPFL